jgi:hypothetical protein
VVKVAFPFPLQKSDMRVPVRGAVFSDTAVSSTLTTCAKRKEAAMLISWLVISKLEPDAYSRIINNDFVKISKNPGFLKPIGITTKQANSPWLVEPGIDVWQEIVRRINKDLVHWRIQKIHICGRMVRPATAGPTAGTATARRRC